MEIHTTPNPLAPNGMPRGLLSGLASLKFTLVILFSLAGGVLAAFRGDVDPLWALALPLGLFAVNLGAAVVQHPAFRRQPPLLLFHLTLIALVLLLAVGRLTYLKGHLELTEGEVFSGELAGWQAGPWHAWRLDRIKFINEGFRINYAPGVQRGPTSNVIAWRDDDGIWRRGVIGDDQPLLLGGYRFYTSSNKGFAPTFAWRQSGRQGDPVIGSVHLPSYPMHEYSQARAWRLPDGGPALWTQLKFAEIILDPERESAFRLPEQHSVVIRVGEGDKEILREMLPGEVLRLPQGELSYLGLRAWMGYTVFHDPTLPWMLAAVLFAVACLSWHLYAKYFSRPWNRGD